MRLTFNSVLCVAMTAAISSSTMGAGALVINWNADYGDWTKGAATGELPGNWYPAAASGRVFLKDLPAGRAMTVGVTRAFGFGPLVMPNVPIEEGKVTQLNIGFHTDYFAAPGAKALRGSVFMQPFTAKGDSVIKAAALFATPPQPRMARYSIWNAGPEGTQVGTMAFRTPGVPCLIGSWCHGQVPLTPGRLYYLRVEGGKGAQLHVKVSDTGNPALPLLVDGKAVPDVALAGWVESDPPGIITAQSSIEGIMKNEPGKEEKDKVDERAGQTFVAEGTSLAMVDFRPFAPGQPGDVAWEVVVRRGGPKGQGLTHQYVQGPNGSVLQKVWSPGEVGLTPGEEYSIEIRRASGGPFKIHRVAGEVNPRGNFVLDEKEVSHLDMDMNIVQYGADIAAPAAPQVRAYSGDGLTRIVYAAPSDPDVRKIQIRYCAGPHNERWPVSPAQDPLLAEVDVLPGQMGVIHHTGLLNFQNYAYALYALDTASNYSKAMTAVAYPGKGPVLPVEVTLMNGGFTQLDGRGASARGWDMQVEVGDPVWQSFRETDGTTAFGWKAATDACARLSQVLTVHPGRQYELTARVRSSGGASAALYVGDPDQAAWTAIGTDYTTLKTTLKAVQGPVRLGIAGRTVGAAELRFADIRIRDQNPL